MVSGLAASRALTMARPMPLLAPVTRILLMAVSVFILDVDLKLSQPCFETAADSR